LILRLSPLPPIMPDQRLYNAVESNDMWQTLALLKSGRNVNERMWTERVRASFSVRFGSVFFHGSFFSFRFFLWFAYSIVMKRRCMLRRDKDFLCNLLVQYGANVHAMNDVSLVVVVFLFCV